MSGGPREKLDVGYGAVRLSLAHSGERKSLVERGEYALKNWLFTPPRPASP